VLGDTKSYCISLHICPVKSGQERQVIVSLLPATVPASRAFTIGAENRPSLILAAIHIVVIPSIAFNLSIRVQSTAPSSHGKAGRAPMPDFHDYLVLKDV
jgi:hypothetical protein